MRLGEAVAIIGLIIFAWLAVLVFGGLHGNVSFLCRFSLFLVVRLIVFATTDLKFRDLTLGWFDALRRLLLLSLGIWTRESMKKFQVINKSKKYGNRLDNKVLFVFVVCVFTDVFFFATATCGDGSARPLSLAHFHANPMRKFLSFCFCLCLLRVLIACVCVYRASFSHSFRPLPTSLLC